MCGEPRSHSVPNVSLPDSRTLFNPNSPLEVSSQSLEELVNQQGPVHSDVNLSIPSSSGDDVPLRGRRAGSCDGLDLDGTTKDTVMSNVNKHLSVSGDFTTKKNKCRTRSPPLRSS